MKRFLLENLVVSCFFYVLVYYSYDLWGLFTDEQLHLYENGLVYIFPIVIQIFLALGLFFASPVKLPELVYWPNAVKRDFLLYIGILSLLFFVECMVSDLGFGVTNQTAGYVVLILIVAPVTEEVIFRGFLMRNEHGTKFLVINSLFFALVHFPFFLLFDQGTAITFDVFEQLKSVFFIFLASLVFGVSYSRGKNLLLAVMLHSLSNVLTLFFF